MKVLGQASSDWCATNSDITVVIISQGLYWFLTTYCNEYKLYISKFIQASTPFTSFTVIHFFP